MSAYRSLFTAFLSFLVPSILVAAPIEIIPPELSGARQPQIALAPSGRIHIVFGKDNALFYTTSLDAHTFSTPLKVAQLDKLALGMRRGPRITATDHLVLITAISHTDGNVHAWLSADGGKAWKETTNLNRVPNSAREGLHALTGNGRGLVASVWLDLRHQGTELRGRVSRDGGLTWENDLSIYQSPDGHICECCVPNVAVSPNGEIAVMWRNWLGGARDLYQSTSKDGQTFTPAKKLGTGTWKLNACPMDGGSLSYSPSGNSLAVWRRARSLFATDPDTPETKLTDNAAQPIIAYAGVTPLVLWEAGGGLMLRRGTEPPSRFADHAAAASMAGSPESAAVVWEASLPGKETLLFDRLP